MLKFKARIYKIGINGLVDVPDEVTQKLTADKGYIWVRGDINGFPFTANLVPSKNGPYRLYVNMGMLCGAQTKIGAQANFTLEQNPVKEAVQYPMPGLLTDKLKEHGHEAAYYNLSEARQKDILKYLHYLKTEAALIRNIDKLLEKLKGQVKNVRIP